MNTDTFRKMVEDGRGVIKIIESVPEDKRVLVSAVAEAFLNGLTAGEKLASREPGRSGELGGQRNNERG